MANKEPTSFVDRSNEEVEVIANMSGEAAAEEAKTSSRAMTMVQPLTVATQMVRSRKAATPRSLLGTEEGSMRMAKTLRQVAYCSQAVTKAISLIHSFGKPSPSNEGDLSGRNVDGTFTKGSEAAKVAGHKGGLHAHGKEDDVSIAQRDEGKQPMSFSQPGSVAAKEAGHEGGLAAAAMPETK